MDDNDGDLSQLLNQNFENHLVDIPPEFFSEDSGHLFSNCLICDSDLLALGAPYVIEKAVKQYAQISSHDVIFEYAMCLSCADKKRDSLSVESQAAIQNYFLEHLDSPSEKPHFSDALEKCWFKGTPKDLLTEYQIFGLFLGDKMIATQPPYLVGEAAISEMGNLLSNKTIGDMDNFIDTYFGGPPELREILKDHKAYLL